MMMYQWKYILYTNQQNTAENRDNMINPYIFKINMYNIYILDSSRNEHLQYELRLKKNSQILQKMHSLYKYL